MSPFATFNRSLLSSLAAKSGRRRRQIEVRKGPDRARQTDHETVFPPAIEIRSLDGSASKVGRGDEDSDGRGAA